MESYIVRIIRREKSDPELILGTVEEVETQKRTGFNSFDQLKNVLTPHKSKTIKQKCDPGHTKNENPVTDKSY